jgi:hypothetical protein
VRSSSIDLVYICDWLPPDFGAVGQYALQYCRDEAQKGRLVTLYGLSSKTSYTEIEHYAPGLLKVVRLRARPYDRTRLAVRALWTAKTNFRLLRAAIREMRNCKEILFTGSPPFMLHLVAPLNVILRKRLTYRITDFYPECLIAQYGGTSVALRLLQWLTRYWRGRVSRFEVLGEDQRRRLVDCGVKGDRILLKRCPSPVPIRQDADPLPRPTSLRGYKLLLYSGNFGAAHDYATFLDGYRVHHRSGSGRVALWLNAVGQNADFLEGALEREGLPYFRSQPVALELLPHLLVTPDAHLITLKAAFWGYVLPSKVYGCIESGRPILYIGPSESDVLLLCRSAPGAPRYFHIRNDHPNDAAQALEEIPLLESVMP